MFVNCLFVYNFAYVYLFNFCFTVICKEKLQLQLQQCCHFQGGVRY